MKMAATIPGYKVKPMKKITATGDDDLPEGEAKASVAQVNALLAEHLPAGDLAIYEAGGGSTSFLVPALLERAHITVLDIDKDQLANNAYADEKILGDLQTHRFPAPRFDLVVCYNVIEHLDDVRAALGNMFAALKPGGLLLIGAPHPNSLSGVITRLSPHWFHVWYYRRVLGRADAGKPGQAPFRTVFHPLVAPRRLLKFAAESGFDILYARKYESPRYPEMRAAHPRLARAIDAAAGLLNTLLLRRRNVRHGDYHLILRKR